MNLKLNDKSAAYQLLLRWNNLHRQAPNVASSASSLDAAAIPYSCLHHFLGFYLHERQCVIFFGRKMKG
jgi:hypothetical protein